jgi:superfamily II DNA or RNA helicase
MSTDNSPDSVRLEAQTGNNIQLRPYQQQLLDDISAQFRAGHRSVLGQMPTGAGKTAVAIVAAHKAAARGKRVLFQAHTRVLIDQTAERFASAGLEFGIIMAGRSSNGRPVQIGSVQTLARRLDKVQPFDLIITDECHRAMSAAYVKIFAAWPRAYQIGLSATPSRLDGRGLGDVYSALVCGPSVAELVQMGHLAPFRVFAPGQPDLSAVKTEQGDYAIGGLSAAMDKPTITGDAVEHFKRLAADRQAIVYACSIAHGGHVAEQFNEAGIVTTLLHSDLSADDQRQAIAGIRSGATQALVSIGMVNEGFDVPGVTCAILLRPTMSLVLASQQWGRANRGGGQSAIILDHAGNTLRHGLPETPRVWSLKGRPKRSKQTVEPGIAIRHCQDCFSVYLSRITACPHCGGIAEKSSRAIEERDGELVEITPEMAMAERIKAMSYHAAVSAMRTVDDVHLIMKTRGYRPGWGVRKVMELRSVDKFQACEMLGFHPLMALRLNVA